MVDLRQLHGIVVERLQSEWKGRAEELALTEVNTSPARFMGPSTTRLEGRYESSPVTIAAGDFLVRTAQPLGILVLQLLEPESLDGVAGWGLLQGALEVGKKKPVRRTIEQLRGATTQGL